MTYKEKYIGEKQIKKATPDGVNIMSIEYMDGSKELVSSLMLDKVLSSEPCDVTELRDKRLAPIVEGVLSVLRNWGLRMSELPQFSVLLSQSLDFNEKQALVEILNQYTGSKMLSPDELDMLTIDKVLKEIKPENNITMHDVLNSPDTK